MSNLLSITFDRSQGKIDSKGPKACNMDLTSGQVRSRQMIRASSIEFIKEIIKRSILGADHSGQAHGKGVNCLSRGVGSSAVRKVLGHDHLLSRDWISPRLDQRLGLIKISLWVGVDSCRRRTFLPRLPLFSKAVRG